jgi:hypothetical protein
MSDAWSEDFTAAPKDRFIKILRMDGSVIVDQWEYHSEGDHGWVIGAVAWMEDANADPR